VSGLLAFLPVVPVCVDIGLGAFNNDAARFAAITGAVDCRDDFLEVPVASPGFCETFWTMPIVQLFGIKSQVATSAAHSSFSRPQKLQSRVVARRHEIKPLSPAFG
jgi:hypothetical protein